MKPDKNTMFLALMSLIADPIFLWSHVRGGVIGQFGAYYAIGRAQGRRGWLLCRKGITRKNSRWVYWLWTNDLVIRCHHRHGRPFTWSMIVRVWAVHVVVLMVMRLLLRRRIAWHGLLRNGVNGRPVKRFLLLRAASSFWNLGISSWSWPIRLCPLAAALTVSQILEANFAGELIVKGSVAVEQQVHSFPFVQLGVKFIHFVEVEEVVFGPMGPGAILGEHVVFDLPMETIYSISTRKKGHLKWYKLKERDV